MNFYIWRKMLRFPIKLYIWSYSPKFIAKVIYTNKVFKLAKTLSKIVTHYQTYSIILYQTVIPLKTCY